MIWVMARLGFQHAMVGSTKAAKVTAHVNRPQTVFFHTTLCICWHCELPVYCGMCGIL